MVRTGLGFLAVLSSVAIIVATVTYCLFLGGRSRYMSVIRAEAIKYRDAEPIVEACYIYCQQSDKWPLDLNSVVKSKLLSPGQCGDWEIIPHVPGDNLTPPVLFRAGSHQVIFTYHFDLGDTVRPYDNWQIRFDGTRIDWNASNVFLQKPGPK